LFEAFFLFGKTTWRVATEEDYFAFAGIPRQGSRSNPIQVSNQAKPAVI